MQQPADVSQDRDHRDGRKARQWHDEATVSGRDGREKMERRNGVRQVVR